MDLKKVFVLTTVAVVMGIATRTDAITVKVWPEKMQVRPNEEVKLDVTVTGLAAGEKAAVECRVVNRIDTEVARFKGETGENGKVTYIFKPGQEFGYEVQAVATKGNEQARDSEVFACSANPWMTAPDYEGESFCMFDLSPGDTSISPAYAQCIKGWVNTCRYKYVPVTELWQCTFSGFGSIVPPMNNYFDEGESLAYKNSAKGVRKLIADLHSNGICSVIYTFDYLCGMSGTEFARQHPEYLCYNRDGTLYGGLETETLRLLKRFYAEYPASLTDAGLMKALDSAPLGEGLDLVLVNCKDLRVVDYAARGLVKGRDFFGYDGVRFDGHYIVGGGGDPLAPASQVLDYSGQSLNIKDADELTARNMRYAIDLIRKQYPDFLFGYNTGIANTGPSSREAATIIPGSYILDEAAKSALNDATEPRNVWSVYAKSMAAEVDSVRHLNGYLFCGWFYLGGTSTEQSNIGRLLKAVGWAAGTRTVIAIYSPDLKWLHDYNRFCYRYSGYILNNNLQRVPSGEAEKLVQVKSVRPVLYHDFVQKMEDRNGKYLVVHLINSPMEERMSLNARIPPQAEGVTVTLSPELFSGRKPDPASIRTLSPDTTPQVQPVVSKQEGGKMTIAVPDFAYWTVLVIPY